MMSRPVPADEKKYQTVREAEGPYIKLFDLRAKCHACNIYGRMAKSVLPCKRPRHSACCWCLAFVRLNS